MDMQIRAMRTIVAGINILALAAAAVAMPAQAGAGRQQTARGGAASTGEASAAIKHVNDAADVVRQMQADAGIKSLLKQARGVYVVPAYGRAALGLGAAGGAGVFAARRADGTWSDPAFFNIGGISIGLQAGAEGGPIAILLMDDKAVNNFRQKNNFNLSADAGLTVVNWNRQAAGTAGVDVVVWSGAKGLFGNVATLSVNDIRFNQKATQSFYGKPANVQDVLEGRVSNPHADRLRKALAESGTSSKR